MGYSREGLFEARREGLTAGVIIDDTDSGGIASSEQVEGDDVTDGNYLASVRNADR